MPSEADVVEMITQVDARGEGSFNLPAFLELMTSYIAIPYSGKMAPGSLTTLSARLLKFLTRRGLGSFRWQNC